MEQIWKFFNEHLTLKHILLFIVVFVIGFVLVKLLQIPLRKVILKTKIDHTVKTFLFSMIKAALYFIVILIALYSAKVDVNSIISTLGAAIFAAGFALQNTLSNFVSGLILLVTKPFTAGDLVEFEGFEGYVESVRLFFTTIRGYDNKHIKIPNSRLTANNVVNCSVGELRRITNVYSVSYDDNITKVRSVILDVISKNDLIVTDPEPKVYVSNHLDSGVEITVFTWAQHDRYFPVLFYMEEQVKRAFDENGITIPYPHLVVKN